MHKLQLFVCFLFLFISSIVSAQLKDFSLNQNGDTINATNNAGQKVGKWVIEMGELRGEPGYVEEGVYKKGEKHGYWRKYTSMGDLLSVENYIYGGKAGLQQYFTFLGELEHEENWKGYNPDAPYDTIPVYGTGSGEIVDFKIVKAQPYSVKDGEWRYYEAGRLIRKEQWSNNNIVNPNTPKVVTGKKPYVKPEKVDKTPAMLDWEKKHRGKKYVEGATHL